VATAIVTKYSTANTVPEPGQLLGGELAYSFPSGNLFIGTENGSYDIIGGEYYTDIINNRNSLPVANTIVVRTDLGEIRARNFIPSEQPGFIGNLQGIADSANTLNQPVLISISGDVIGNVTTNFNTAPTITVSLSETGVAAGTYGNTTNIPLITVDASGRIVNVSNLQISVASQELGNSAYNQANLAF